jgi:Tol biopolymer transport system component
MTIRPDGSGRRLVGGRRCAVAPDWSADGRLACIGVMRHGRSVRWVIAVAGRNGRLRRILPRRGSVARLAYPAWSPDGRRLAFLRGRSALHVIDADGRHDHRLDKHATVAAANPVAWSPDGTRLAFTQRRPSGRTSSGRRASGSLGSCGDRNAGLTGGR